MCDYCSWINEILHPKIDDLPTICTNIRSDERENEISKKITVKYDPTILVHGTADSTRSREENESTLEKIEKAAVEAYKELAKGCQAVEAAEIAIRSLEKIQLNSDSDVDVAGEKINPPAIRDAALMDSLSNAGAVGASNVTRHPITLAKKVLRETDHLLIVGNGIRNFEISTKNSSTTHVPDDVLRTPPNSINFEAIEKGLRLYGAVARDRKGILACGNSTTDDRPQSVEISSMTASATIPGCGIFANAKFCCSVSSDDRAVYVYAPARKIIERFQRDNDEDSKDSVRIEDALNDELEIFFKNTGSSCIGAAGLGVNGMAEVAFTSRYFPWARCDNGVVTSGYVRDEVFEKDVGELDMPMDCRCD